MDKVTQPMAFKSISRESFILFTPATL